MLYDTFNRCFIFWMQQKFVDSQLPRNMKQKHLPSCCKIFAFTCAERFSVCKSCSQASFAARYFLCSCEGWEEKKNSLKQVETALKLLATNFYNFLFSGLQLCTYKNERCFFEHFLSFFVTAMTSIAQTGKLGSTKNMEQGGRDFG